MVLSPSDLALATDAMQVLLSPLDYADIDDWRRETNRRLVKLLGADSAGFILPVATGPVVYSEEHDPKALAAYPELSPPPLSSGQSVFERGIQLGASTLADVWGDDMHINLASAYFNEYVAPNRAHDALSAIVPLPRLGPHGMAGLQFWHSSLEGRSFGIRESTLLRLLMPALRAGIETQLRWDAHRGDLLSALDRLSHATLVCDRAGVPLHHTPALTATLEADPEGAELLRAMREVASSTAAAEETSISIPSSGFTRKVITGRASYRLSGSLFRSPFTSAPVLVLVALERTTPVIRSAAELSEAYRLTKAEIRVAALLVRGFSTLRIATELILSAHTVRRHTERIFAKTGVRSRSELAAKILA